MKISSKFSWGFGGSGFRWFGVLAIFIFIMGSVCALGVTPGRTTVNFEPDLKKDVEFEIINSGGAELELSLSVEGELGRYINLPSRTVSFAAGEESKKVSYSVSLPHSLEPGTKKGEVAITEVPRDAGEGESIVQATLAVAVQFHVNVPFPGKYANANLIIYNVAEGEDVTFVFPVVSAGEFDLTSVKANVDVYNKLNEKVGSFSTSDISVPSGTKKELVYKWANDLPIGDYRAAATLIYDEGVVNLEQIFSVGLKELELQDITVSSFSLGQIAKLEMLVENKWSEPISDAYIETFIKSDSGKIVSNFKSSAYDVDPLGKQVFVSYWDTAGVSEGNYQTEVSINYGDSSSKKNLEFQVKSDELVIVGLGYVISGEDGGVSGEGGPLITVLIIVIVLLVLINLLWFLLLRKKLKK
jgi:hypothetical protein